MKTNTRKQILGCSTAVIFMAALWIGGCGGSQKPEIEVALWNLNLHDGFYADYMEAVDRQVPDVKIHWVKGESALGYYQELAEEGNLPDIITARRFSMKGALELNPYLMKLTGSELTSSYYDIYLENYKTSEGEVFWLPMAGTVDGIIANRALFEEYQIPIPLDFEGFVFACQEFERYGIRAYSLDFSADYNSMHFLQGMGIESLCSVDGIAWRKEYEEGRTDQLDSAVWMPAFEKMEKLIRQGVLKPEMINYEDSFAYDDFAEGRQAMTNISSESISRLLPGMDLEILPYFGDKQNFLLTYPIFNVAVSKKVEESEKKEEAAWKVLSAMASEETQKLLNKHTDGLVPYQRDISFEYTGSMNMVQNYLETNSTYVRLATDEFFTASRDTVVKMLEEELPASIALDLMNENLRQLQEK